MRSLVLNLFSFCIPYFLPGMLFKVLLYMLHTTVEVLGAGEGERGPSRVQGAKTAHVRERQERRRVQWVRRWGRWRGGV